MDERFSGVVDPGGEVDEGRGIFWEDGVEAALPVPPPK